MEILALTRRTWHGGQLLAFSGLDGATDFERGLVGRTAFDRVGIDVKLPAECRLTIPGRLEESLVAGDFLEVRTSEGRTRGAFLDAHHLLVEGPCSVEGQDNRVTSIREGRKTLLAGTTNASRDKISADMECIIAERKRWLERQRVPGGLSTDGEPALCKALSVMKTQVCSPEGAIRYRWTTPDRWPHRGMWLWDSVFHAIGWRHLDPSLARDMISSVLGMQREDGFIPHFMKPTGVSGITQPPVLSFGAKLVSDKAPSPSWIKEIYPHLCAYVKWDFANRDNDGGGLAEWFIEGDKFCRSGESGMDNSPRFDEAHRLDATDFNSFLALECETLAGFADELGLAEDSREWREKHKTLCGLINKRCWSEELQFYVDYDVEKKKQSNVLASSGFLPLICGAASREQVKMLAAHLEDPTMFGTPFPIPSIAAKDKEHYSKDMWRGPVWVNINWLAAYGLERYGMKKDADKLRSRTTDEIERFCRKHGTLFEFYDDRCEVDPPQLLRKGSCVAGDSYHQVIHDYGWTAALYVDLVYSRVRNKGTER